MLNLTFLGKARVEYNGKSVVEGFRNKTIALICLLVINNDKYLSREKILDYLWPDSSEEAAKNNLRFNLWLIKKNIGTSETDQEFLFIDKDHCGINFNYEFQCDILDIMNFKPQQDQSIESLLRLKNMFVGEFLEGCYYNNCDDFNEIIIFERTRFENFRVQILKSLEELYEKEGNTEECLNILKEILDIEQYDEEVAAQILTLYMKIGNRGSGIVFYNSFRDRLASRLGIQPSEKLRKRYEELKKSEDTKLQPEDLKDIKIKTICIRGVQYFWMADVIGKLFALKQLDCDTRLNEKMLKALGYIQPDITRSTKIEGGVEVPAVQLVNAFIHLILNICKDYRLTIFITGIEDMDSVSEGVLKYLKSSNVNGLSIIEN
nr:BTAD domain-containing putative transcriptional regulator [uncultured Aminipila sp.]